MAVQRRLAAILAADVVGYSRLMGNDEEGTLMALNSHLTESIEPCIAEHRGRVVKTTGDGLLAEFASVVDAVSCAVAFQEGMSARNSEIPEDHRLVFRIGVNTGDVIIQGNDVFGDGVNVAARLEELAEPGGVVISGKVYDEVRAKTELHFDDLGPHKVKNILDPVRAYSARSKLGAGITRDARLRAPSPLSGKPSIAVLPFDNMSGDPEQSYFSDGITEDIITFLSRVHQFDVLGRNTTFTFKGQAVDLRQVAKQLGSQYLVEGSVRRSGNRVRVTAQLIDGGTGNHIWADRYDRDLDDLFAIQDEITNEIVVALQVELSEGEQARLFRGQTRSIEAWDYYVQGLSEHRRSTREGATKARELLQKAVAIDPNFAAGWVFLGRVHWQNARAPWNEDPISALDRASECAQNGLSINDQSSEAHALIGMIHMYRRRFDEAIAEGRKAVELGPNISDNYLPLAQTLNYAGKPSEAAALLEKAMRLSRYHPGQLLGVLANSYRLLGRFEEAIELDTDRLKRDPDNYYSDFRLAALYMELGREENARQHIANSISKHPSISLRYVRASEPYRDATYLDHYVDLLRRAGMPE